MSFLCSTCSVYFDGNFQRREHMREEWHVYNVKRKLASLPPISSVTYRTNFPPLAKPKILSETKEPPTATDHRDTETRLSDYEDELLDPQQCIFCLVTSETTVQNVEHMAAFHGLMLPNLEKLETDLETLISYLGLVATHYCECLFCGAIKRSAHAARMHMLAKGHCMLDLSEGSEFLEFWQSERRDDQHTEASGHRDYQLLSRTEMRLASGAIATSRNDSISSTHHRRRRWSKEEQTPREELPTPQRSDETVSDRLQHAENRKGRRQNPVPSRASAIRDQMGLTGLSNSERRALAVSQRKIDLSALRSRNKAQWTLEKMGNKVKQKHFVVGSPCRSGWFLDPVMR